ncbi:hypothetical protein A2U01_0030016, partial [Trifolium medium]|nr:hypothetical protein [Trifolium medium]
MHCVSFWARIYELPLKMRSEAMAKKLGDFIGKFEEADQRDANRLGRFLRVKISIDLRKPLKRGTVVHYQGRGLKVFFKYERLPNFCFLCGRIGHQMRECEENSDQGDGDYGDIEETEQSYGPWLRASPLPKVTAEQRKDSSSGTCKSLGTVSISPTSEVVPTGKKATKVEGKKWVRRRTPKKPKCPQPDKVENELRKRQLVDVVIS